MSSPLDICISVVLIMHVCIYMYMHVCTEEAWQFVQNNDISVDSHCHMWSNITYASHLYLWRKKLNLHSAQNLRTYCVGSVNWLRMVGYYLSCTMSCDNVWHQHVVRTSSDMCVWLQPLIQHIPYNWYRISGWGILSSNLDHQRETSQKGV